MCKGKLTAIFLCIFTIFSLNGCVSHSINDSLALIESENNTVNNKTVNKTLLKQIEILRQFQHNEQLHTFTYQLNSKELNDTDKLKISEIMHTHNEKFIVNIAPAKSNSSLKQLALSIERAKALRLYVEHFNKKVVFNFSPKLPSDTVNLVVGV